MNALKKIARIVFLLIAFISVSSELAAQRRVINHLPRFDKEPYHFGFILAINQMFLTYRPIDGYQSDLYKKDVDAKDITFFNGEYYRINSINTDMSTGFCVGIVGNLRLGEYFDFRFIPTLSFGDRLVNYSIQIYNSNLDSLSTISTKKTIRSTKVDFPFHLKYRSKRYNNFAAYLLVGINPSIEMVSRKTNLTQNSVGGTGQAPDIIDPSKFDFAIDTGVGFDFYTPYFKFGIEGKMSYGLINVISQDPQFNNNLYANSLSYLNNKVFQLSFTFE